MFKVPEDFRFTDSPVLNMFNLDSKNGVFVIPMESREKAQVIASDAFGWEHVSISFRDRCPTWEEMCFIKNLFWDAEDLVIQIHPPASEYVNNHPYCLHLFRKVDTNDFCETPPSILVGIPGLERSQGGA